MKKTSGFTLLEIMLVLVVLAASTSLIISAGENRQGALSKASLQTERLDELMQYASDWSVMRGQPLGLSITQHSWQLLESVQSRWRPFSEKSRLPSNGNWDSNWNIMLLPQVMMDKDDPHPHPQILILPNGEITPFSLYITDKESQRELASLSSNGFLPLAHDNGVSLK